MDMVFSAPVHQDPQLIIDIVDEVWAAETLPIEDIEVPANSMAGVDDDDPTAANEQEEEDKWNDFGVDELSISTAMNGPVGEIALAAPSQQGVHVR